MKSGSRENEEVSDVEMEDVEGNESNFGDGSGYLLVTDETTRMADSPDARPQVGANGNEATNPKTGNDNEARVDSAADNNPEYDDGDDEFSFASMDCDDEETAGDVDAGPAVISGPFDVKLLRSCIEDAGPTLAKLENKNVVLVVGKTGAGKSLFLQGVSGKKIVAVTHQSSFRGRTVETKVFDALDPSPDFEIGHDKISKTRSINCLTRHGVGKNKEDIVYVDSPGWEDTGGPEQDIAASVMIGEVIKKARSLRLVVLINFASLLEDRGGAMRDVLKLARAFVSDFEKKKQSFMFLFTHVNEVLGETSDSIDTARSCVEKEVLRIRHGTGEDDSDVQAVLKFIHTSLGKKYGFVDVLNPLVSNFNDLSRFIETRLRPIQNPSAEANYGLTGKSQLKLDGEIHKHLHSLRRLLHQRVSDQNINAIVDEMKEVRSTIGYFSLHIKTPGVRAAFDECEKLCQDQMTKHRLAIDAEVEKATNKESYFASGNVFSLRALLAQMEILSKPDERGGSISEHYVNTVFAEAFRISAERISAVSALDDLGHTLKELGKLKSWSDGFPSFRDAYIVICSQLKQQVDTIGEDLSCIDAKGFDSLNEGELVQHAQKFSILCLVDQSKTGFDLHDIDTEHYSRVIFKSRAALSALLRKWDTVSKTVPNRSQKQWKKNNLSFLFPTAERVKQLEVWRLHVQPHLTQGCHRDLLEAIDASLDRMGGLATEQYSCLCDSFSGSIDIQYDRMEKDFKALHRVHSKYKELSETRWKQLLQLYREVLEHLESHTKLLCEEVENAATQCSNNGVVDGHEDAERLDNLRSFLWFDRYAGTTCEFVKGCFDAACMTYQMRLKMLVQEGKSQSSKLRMFSVDNIEHLGKCHEVFAEISQFECFGSILWSDSRFKTESDEAFTELSKYEAKLDTKSSRLITDWSDSFNECNYKKVKDLTEKMSSLLREIIAIRSLRGLSDLHEEAEKAQNKLILTLKSVNDEIELEFTRPGSYKRKSEYLAFMDVTNGFPETDRYLPRLDAYKEKARHLVNGAVLQLETMMTESADSECVGAALSDLEGAKILDPFTDNEATNRLRPLQSLLESRQEEQDQMVNSMIENEDFAGIGKFLKPMHTSRDVLKQQKLQQHTRTIAKLLTDRLSSTKRKLQLQHLSSEDVDYVKDAMDMLSVANKEVGDLLASANADSPDSGTRRNTRSKARWLSSEIAALKGGISCRVRVLSEAVLEGEGYNDFLKMGRNMLHATLITEKLGTYVDQREKKKFRQVESEWESAKVLVPDLVDMFVSSSFEKCRQLERAMASLENASKSENPHLPDLQELFTTTMSDLTGKVNARLGKIRQEIEETESYDDGIYILENLAKAEDLGLRTFLGPFPFDYKLVLDKWKEEQSELHDMGESEKYPEKVLPKKRARLDSLKGAWTIRRYVLGTERTYRNLQSQMENWMRREHQRGLKSIEAGDIPPLRKSLNTLELMAKELGEHVPLSNSKRDEVRNRIEKKFVKESKKAVVSLQSSNLVEFEGAFPGLRQLVINFAFLLEHSEVKKEFDLVNQLAHDVLKSKVTELHEAVSSHNFLELRVIVKWNRTHGAFLADHYSLLFEELKQHDRFEGNEWLSKIWDISCDSFSCGRDLMNIKSFAILGIVPSSSEEEIRKGYKLKAREVHPDKNGDVSDSGDSGQDFRRVKDAYDHLLAALQVRENSKREQLFDSTLRDLPSDLKKFIRECMQNQRYGRLEHLLERLPDFQSICNLVDPPMDYGSTEDSIIQLVKEHVGGIRLQVDTRWNERKYRLLNESITDLKLMENHLKSFPKIFPKSWNQGIIESVEKEINSLGAKARGYLRDRGTAAAHVDEFRRCLLQMGAVLVELEMFKVFTKSEMYSILEKCLQSDWGYSYLFELGLSFHRESESDEEARIGHTILSEFSHFKEVMTMVWNEETTQKPVEDTVKDIKGEKRSLNGAAPGALDIDKGELLSSFHCFESEYKSILGEYLPSHADKGKLVRKTTELANSIRPLTCCSGWNYHVKQQLPRILAGVFALFTILKSGESFNRMQETQGAQNFGEKILMKPHNIQVLTLLYLLGCGKVSSTSLESQLMQIRTGEGKSMVLGAAAAVLGLLGFKVRCVCYSEYLSNRDYSLFEPVFTRLGLDGLVTYSKITTLSEDTTRAKGDLRGLTQTLLEQKLTGPRSMYGDCQHLAQGEQQPKKKVRVGNRTPTIASTPPRRSQRLRVPTDNAPQRLKADDKPSDRGNVVASSPGLNMAASSPSVRGANSGTTISVNVPNANNERPLDLSNVDTSAALTKISRTRSPVSATTTPSHPEEILLVDEVDVFFGKDFYGQTYNQVAELKRPEISEIITFVWETYQQTGRKPKLAHVQATTAYQRLVTQMPLFQFLFDNEIRLMIDHVQRVDEEKYFLDSETDRIGYKVLDAISYQVTYGYRTVFAYLKEAYDGNLKDKTATLNRVLVMPVSCGQFSYANVQPQRILGVSGTLSSMGSHEKNVLLHYGVENYVFVPSVYGRSNFVFDKAGDGIYIENNESDFFQRVCDEILSRVKEKRAAIVFFKDDVVLEEFKESPFYPKLGRGQKVLLEKLEPSEKEYVIAQAARSKQITLCPAVFGRGTDFFCKDEAVQNGGGVHIIQTFLSAEISEEVQIRGRTCRQGKKGSYQLVLLESDLCKEFGVKTGSKDNVRRDQRYEWLCGVRERQHDEHWKKVKENLAIATQRDEATHKYFDSLLDGNQPTATKLFKDLYCMVKKPPAPESITIDVAFLVDITGSMAPYCKHAVSTIHGMIEGSNSILVKLGGTFPDTDLKLRAGVLGYRDIDDGPYQFIESAWDGGDHFSNSIPRVMSYANQIASQPWGGKDLAEDHLGAIHRCMNWNGPSDWSSSIKIIVLFTDAPAHGCVPSGCSVLPNIDGYSVRHPKGLTASNVSDGLVSKGVNVFMCSYNPAATVATEEMLAKEYVDHPQNFKGREVVRISMVLKSSDCTREPGQSLFGDHPRHIVFVLDESGSMQHNWSGVVESFQKYIAKRRQNQNESDLVSVVQFGNHARVTMQNEPIASASTNLGYAGGGTQFAPAALEATRMVTPTPSSHKPTVVFMSDGGTHDANQAALTFTTLNQHVKEKYGCDLELHVIAFGGGADTQQLQAIARSSPIGRVHLSSDTASLTKVFVSIAGGQDVASVLQGEIAKEISEAVTDTLCVEYLS